MNGLAATPRDVGEISTGVGLLDGFEDIAGNIDNDSEEDRASIRCG